MFFVLSKIFWALAQPVSLIVVLSALALVLLWFERHRSAGTLLFVAVSIGALGGYSTLGVLMIRPLEDRFPPPARPPQQVDAIIVLGGGFDGKVSRTRNEAELRASGDRFVEAIALAMRYPEAKVVISGGFGSLFQEGDTDAVIAKDFYPRFGIGPDRLLLEGESRNTAENAAFVKGLLKPGGTVLLVTSAFHMPRSVGLFRKAGVEVVPWPVDYRSTGEEGVGLDFDNPVENLFTTSTAIREWLGLVAYKLTGQIDDLLPSP